MRSGAARPRRLYRQRRSARASAPAGPFVFERINFFIYGFYPIEQRWRVDVFFALLALRHRLAACAARAVQAGCGDLFLRRAADRVGHVPARLCAARPVLCVDLAVGRRPGHASWWRPSASCSRCRSASCWRSAGARTCRSVRLFSVIFIEFVRGVPLITVLFMASVMLPLFVPEAWSPDKLLRALIGVALFAVGLYGRGGARRPAGDPARPVRGRAWRWGSATGR